MGRTKASREVYGFCPISKSIIEDVHRQVNEHRAKLGLTPYDFSGKTLLVSASISKGKKDKRFVIAVEDNQKAMAAKAGKEK